MLAGLPHSENAQMHNIHFVTCSNQASATDMMEHIVTDLQRLEDGITVYDAHLQQKSILIAPVMAFLCDNPRHSEMLNHAGGCANKYCRMCMVCLISFHNPLTFNTTKKVYHFTLHIQADRNSSPTEVAVRRTKELALAQMQEIATPI